MVKKGTIVCASTELRQVAMPGKVEAQECLWEWERGGIVLKE